MFTVRILTVCLFFVSGVLAGPTQISAGEKTFRNDANFPNIQFTLISIEEKLRNLENTLSMQCTAIVEGKIEHHGNKIDNIQKDLSRFQILIQMELDKISENISSKNFRDDIIKDRIIRKIDAVYERVHHKLESIEGQIDLSSMKFENAREMVMSKLEKMEESLTIRDADMEAELADAVAAIDDLKTTCSNMEENILNVTMDTTKTISKNTEKNMKKHHTQTINIVEDANKNLLESVTNLQGIVDSMMNETNSNLNIAKDAQEELEENLNEYVNKISDMYSDLWKKTDIIHNTVHMLEKVLNTTRNEQQNALRALTIEVGRKSGKQSNSLLNDQKLEQLSQKMDANFDSIMEVQNSFLESCHRVQMDEPQLETQISMILHKVIDIFEKKTAVEPKDIEKLEHLLRTHDSNIRGNIYHIANTLLASTNEVTNEKDEIMDYINNQNLQIEALYAILQDIFNSTKTTTMQSILDTLQVIQLQLNETSKQAETSQLQINLINKFLNYMLKAPQDTFHLNNIKLEQIIEFIKNIYHILMGMEMKINKSYLDHYFNKYNIDAIAHRFDQQLNKYIQNQGMTATPMQEHISEAATVSPNKKQMSELILQIFGDPLKQEPTYSNQSRNATTNDSIDKEEILCLNANTSIICENINNTKYLLLKPNETDTGTNNTKQENSQNASKSEQNKTHTMSLNDVTQAQGTETKKSSLKCLPTNITNLIDVRSNSGTNMSDCNEFNIIVNGSVSNFTNITNSTNNTIQFYDIDVHFKMENLNDTDSKGNITQTSLPETTLIEPNIETTELTEITTSATGDTNLNTENLNEVITNTNYIILDDELFDETEVGEKNYEEHSADQKFSEINQELEYTENA